VADTRRREAVLASALNGIDYVEILDADAPTPADRQRFLRVTFLKSPPPAGLAPANFAISGGERITGITVDGVTANGGVLLLHLSAYGDFSIYQLTIQAASGSGFDPATVDPLFASAAFSFKADSPSDFDCQAAPVVVTPWPRPPQLDYLSKDYASFRQMMLDRIAALAPQWQERNTADLGVTLVELVAHVGDLLSYRQDAIATEAYLGTARRRTSIRRHARLVDYVIQDGVNARTFLQAQVSADLILPQGTQALTSLPGVAPRLAPGSADLVRAMGLSPQVFETLSDAQMRRAHNAIPFHTWGEESFRIPQGATRATLKGQFPNLQAGDWLMFEEVLGPRTGEPNDADPARRCAVRLISVTADSDPVGGAFETPPTTTALAVTEIEWARADALPFPFQVAAEVLSGGVARRFDTISVARGNLVLADHGATVASETVGPVPQPWLFRPPTVSDGFIVGDATPIPPRFRPRLASGPLAFGAPYDPADPPSSAKAALATSPADAHPLISLSGAIGGQPSKPWMARRDLLQSDPDAADFVVETETDGSAWLRFGDDTYGQRPPPGTLFSARYRIGDPLSGNVAADAITHVVSPDGGVTSLRNPLPASGGVAPESLEHVRQAAPFAFRTQQRAVTPADYQAAAEGHPEVRRAAATFRWTGSWQTIFLTIDRVGGLPVDADFAASVRSFLEPFRLAGHDLQVDGPCLIGLDIALLVTVDGDHFRGDVERALLAVFGAGLSPDGRPQVFNPDSFTFGQSVYLSVIYAAAQAVDGVAAVDVTTFQRRDRPGGDGLTLGRLDFDRLEIPRLDNNPDFPERGTLKFTMGGGK
jgi:hypothetical protein